MNQPQQKIIKKWGSTRLGFVTGCAFLHSDGSVTDAEGRGVNHDWACHTAKTTLTKYLQSGGVRVLIYSYRGKGICVFETAVEQFSPGQLLVIKRTIRKGNFGGVEFSLAGKFTIIEDFQRVTVGKCKEVLC